jgi:hypothetical protein
MAKYFLDTEFIEGFHKPLLKKKRHFIDLISIGIVAEDGRKYYAVSKDFDLDYVWYNKDTWLKENVLKPIWEDFVAHERYCKTYHPSLIQWSYKGMKNLLKWHGYTSKQIAEDVKQFVYNPFLDSKPVIFSDNWHPKDVEFYGYFADYDWVVFCSLFGRMIDLPKGFPFYCRDLKQMLDGKVENYSNEDARKSKVSSIYTVEIYNMPASKRLDWIKKYVPAYPHQDNEHNALDDALWNKRLYNFINEL